MWQKGYAIKTKNHIVVDMCMGVPVFFETQCSRQKWLVWHRQTEHIFLIPIIWESRFCRFFGRRRVGTAVVRRPRLVAAAISHATADRSASTRTGRATTRSAAAGRPADSRAAARPAVAGPRTVAHRPRRLDSWSRRNRRPPTTRRHQTRTEMTAMGCPSPVRVRSWRRNWPSMKRPVKLNDTIVVRVSGQ